MARTVCSLALLIAVAPWADAFYLPGVAPQDFSRDDLVYFKVRTGCSSRRAAPKRSPRACAGDARRCP